MIRKAEIKDIPALGRLLRQVLEVHAEGRPDIFRTGTRKYSDEELERFLRDEERPVFVHTDENDETDGYAFCILEPIPDSHVLQPVKTLYIDDICVDESKRHRHIASALYAYVRDYAKSIGCYHITLNVWTMNPAAQRFYEKMGMKPLKTEMEDIL